MELTHQRYWRLLVLEMTSFSYSHLVHTDFFEKKLSIFHWRTCNDNMMGGRKWFQRGRQHKSLPERLQSLRLQWLSTQMRRKGNSRGTFIRNWVARRTNTAGEQVLGGGQELQNQILPPTPAIVTGSCLDGRSSSAVAAELLYNPHEHTNPD